MSTDVAFSSTSAAAPSATTPALPDDVPTLQALIVELLAALRQERHEREGLQQRLDQLLRRLYGPKAERFDPHQPWLLAELAPVAGAEPSPAPTPAAGEPARTTAPAQRPGHGRLIGDSYLSS